MDAPVLKVVEQRHKMDCGVACLAMLCGVSYENALVAVAQEIPNVCVEGLHVQSLRSAAKRLGFDLKRKRHYDCDEDTGILCVQFERAWHYVVLSKGLIVNTDGTIWESDVYFNAEKAKPQVLFVAEKREIK